MLCRSERKGNVEILRVSEKLDFNSTRELEAKLKTVLEDGAVGIVIDMRQVDYIASVAIGVFVEAQKNCQDKGGQIVLLKPRSKVRDILKLVHLGRVISIIERETEALEKAKTPTI